MAFTKKTGDYSALIRFLVILIINTFRPYVELLHLKLKITLTNNF